MLQRYKAAATAACLAQIVSPAIAQTRQCPGAAISVTSQNAHYVDLICDAATLAEGLFAGCALPALQGPIRVDVVADLPSGCFGFYHCGDSLMEVLAPDIMDAKRNPDSVFSHVATDAYFQTIIVHELAHAATENMPCPFDRCLVGSEYIAYLMQLKSLDSVAIDGFEATIDMNAPVTFEGFNPFILMLAPDVFSQRVWAHYNQQEDPCGFVAQLIKGEALLDFELLDQG